MGYFVELVDSTFVIPKIHLDEAYRRVVALNDDDRKKTGGSWSSGECLGKWFAWMPPDYPEKCKDAQAVFEELGFGCHRDENGSLHLDSYHSKTGQEELFLEAVKDLVHGQMKWKGEDDVQWTLTFGSPKYRKATDLPMTVRPSMCA